MLFLYLQQIQEIQDQERRIRTLRGRIENDHRIMRVRT